MNIIILASGFNRPHENMEKEILAACAEKILIFAAASNSGNSDFITFPANIPEVICMFATDANAKAITSRINPSPSLRGRPNFAIFGHEVESRPRSKPQTGTSISTFIGAGIAGLILEFSRQSIVSDIIGTEWKRYLQTVRGMSAIFELMAEGGHEGYHCITPWKIRPIFQKSQEFEREFIANAIKHALERCIRGA